MTPISAKFVEKCRMSSYDQIFLNERSCPHGFESLSVFVRNKQTSTSFYRGPPKSISFLGKRSSNGAHEKTGLKPVFDSSVVCCDVVRSKGSDRLLRLACRLPPRLPSRSPSDHSLFECSQDIRITLMPSRVRIPSVLV